MDSKILEIAQTAQATNTPNEQIRFPWKIANVAAMLSQTKVNGRNKLFTFLRAEGVIQGDLPLQEYIDLGYFKVDYDFEILYKIWSPPRIRVSALGVAFIKKLVFQKLGEDANHKKCINRKPGKLTNLNTLLK
ncbi:hypothetical protein [Dyadobacter sp. 3J3]|uniref:hypothetical protein n=1 Tax=Dyadobacter sp. 3J3 TaxID=2606600 RepID=UPI001359D7D0|nr:hypothetical protein [Dyadobacter sp. 3J3]